MGAVERSGYRFEPEFSVINQNGAIHVYSQGKFVEEIKFSFLGEFPEHDEIEKLLTNTVINVEFNRKPYLLTYIFLFVEKNY